MIQKRANLCGKRYTPLYGDWYNMYTHVIDCLVELGYEVRLSPFLDLGGGDRRPDIPIGLEGSSPEDLHIYNHTYIDDIKHLGLYVGPKCLFIKPSGPTPKHFSLDTQGYGCHVSIAYNKPDFENYDYRYFFTIEVPKIIENKVNKWTGREILQSTDLSVNIPKDHVLVLGQMPLDETVVNFSFGNHWEKVVKVVSELQKESNPIVVKLHPEFYEHHESKKDLDKTLEEWQSKNIVVIKDLTSLHDILPSTKVAILENSTSGLECLLHKVPIISYGYPEYHWVTKDLRHVIKLNEYINDLSWYDEEKAKAFIAWYSEQFMCYDKNSTFKRLKSLIKKGF